MHESTDHTLTPAERELESALRSLVPSGDGVDACALAFRMGETRARSAVRRWQGAAGTLGVLALAGAIGTLQGARPVPGVASDQGSRIVETTPTIEQDRGARTERVSMPMVTPESSAYVRQRARALALGAGSLGTEGVMAERSPGPAPAARQEAWDLFLQAFSAGGAM